MQAAIRRSLLVVAGAAALVGLVKYDALGLIRPSGAGVADLSSFWLAGRVFLGRGNPYDVEQITAASYSSGLNGLGIQPIWHFPWDMFMFSLFALLPFRVLADLMYIGNIGAAAALPFWVLSLHRRTRCAHHRPRWFILFAGLTIVTSQPFWHTINWGQFSLLFPVALLAAYEAWLVDRRILSGLCLSITFLKLHLFLPFYLLVAVYCLQQRDRRLLTGMAAGFFICAGTTCLLNPAAVLQYLQLFLTPGDHAFFFFDPTLGAWLQALYPEQPLLRFVPLLVVLALAGLHLARDGVGREKHHLWTILYSLLAGLLVAPHIWSYDFSILLPLLWITVLEAGCFLQERRARPRLCLLLAAGCLLLQAGTFAGAGMNLMIWYPLGALLFMDTVRRMCLKASLVPSLRMDE